jgi:hypothetical protein
MQALSEELQESSSLSDLYVDSADEIKLAYFNLGEHGFGSLGTAQQHWRRGFNPCVFTAPMAPARTTLMCNVSASGDSNAETVREVSIAEITQTAADSSSSLMRAPAQAQDFVRGKVGHQPFKPGGIAKSDADHVLTRPAIAGGASSAVDAAAAAEVELAVARADTAEAAVRVLAASDEFSVAPGLSAGLVAGDLLDSRLAAQQAPLERVGENPEGLLQVSSHTPDESRSTVPCPKNLNSR